MQLSPDRSPLISRTDESIKSAPALIAAGDDHKRPTKFLSRERSEPKAPMRCRGRGGVSRRLDLPFHAEAGCLPALGGHEGNRPFVICSNTNAAHWDFLNRRCGLDRLAAKAILSHECGCEKPAPEIYRLAAAAHGREPSECLFVDDLAAQVEAAKALGFHTHHFMGYEAPP
jgi:hypothetical protein